MVTEIDEATERAEPAPAPEVAPEAPSSGNGSESAQDRPLNADGRERPGFLLQFPADPELQRLVRAFEAGNYEAVRHGAPGLAQASEDPAVRAAARELLRRIDPDPLLKFLLWIAIALFVFVVWYTYQNHGR